MRSSESADSSVTRQLLDELATGDDRALERLVERHRQFLGRLVEMRMEPTLRRRVDPSDVVQETLIVATKRMGDFLERRPTSFRLWLRRKAMERLIDHRRRHFAQKRNVGRDLSLTEASSAAIARRLLGDALTRHEVCQMVQASLMKLSAADREMLVLRHAEELSNAEIAEMLGLDAKTVSKRYGRALRRLSTQLAEEGISSWE